MNLYLYKSVFLCYAIFVCINIVAYPLYAQKLISDTVFFSFKPDYITDASQISIRKFTDLRNVPNAQIAYQNKRKYWLVPTEVEYYLNKPLCNALTTGFGNKPQTPELELQLINFEIDKYKGNLFQHHTAEAALKVYSKTDSLQYLGTLIYEINYEPVQKKETYDITCQNIIQELHGQLKRDLITIYNDSSKKIPNLFVEEKTKLLYLTAQTNIVLGINFWQAETELYFSSPEITTPKIYKAGIIRYQHTPEFETISIGRKSEHLLYRWHNKWSIDIAFNLLVGFNRWSNFDAVNPSIYQIFNLSVSSTQTIAYIPYNTSGGIVTMGLFQNIYTIYNYKTAFQIGIVLGTGYRL